MYNQPNKQDSTEIYSEVYQSCLLRFRLLSALTITEHKRWKSVCTYSNLPVIRLAVKLKFVSPPIQVPFISPSFLQREKKIMKLHCHTNDCLDVHYLSGYLLCTKMVCMECKPGAVNTVLTMLGSHPPSSPFSEQSFCADSIFLWMLLNRWLQSAVGENLWNKQMPPEITIKPMSIYADEGKTTLHQKGIILLLLTLTFNYIIFLFCWKKCRCMWIQM